MEKYYTKKDAIDHLQQMGYKLDFIIENENLLCIQKSELINPDDFEITETYRFDSDESRDGGYVIYAVKSAHKGLKGILATSYTSFFKGLSIHLWSKLSSGLNN